MKRVVTFFLAAGLVFAVATPAPAAPVSSDPATTAAKAAASWLAQRVNASGFIPLSSNATQADFSSSVQAVTALAAAGVGKPQISALLTYLGDHVDDYVGSGGADDPGALANLILGAKPAVQTRLRSVPRTPTSWLACSRPNSRAACSAPPPRPTTVRRAKGCHCSRCTPSASPTPTEWPGSRTSSVRTVRSTRSAPTPSAPCPAVDPTTFAGSDTNSTAFALLGLADSGRDRRRRRCRHRAPRGAQCLRRVGIRVAAQSTDRRELDGCRAGSAAYGDRRRRRPGRLRSARAAGRLHRRGRRPRRHRVPARQREARREPAGDRAGHPGAGRGRAADLPVEHLRNGAGALPDDGNHDLDHGGDLRIDRDDGRHRGFGCYFVDRRANRGCGTSAHRVVVGSRRVRGGTAARDRGAVRRR